ncbi:acyl-CoA dehydrogenase [Allokutzneria sp. A3M-2-11 16]|uniref:acyl-CoA dehydrogenase family protein n=1 Tax=Allokutzneria sp. A3M-2-11 16 TaxID=2962043 RepID=UPI0020B74BD2|nr:acyl-CoA dehydrogenase [Allokutzneria sp. A3M-2-11 16]MCP3803852.1 acyl-CoA dehydrogenase [Allokutzneria sp. A3M-2-11 16]
MTDVLAEVREFVRTDADFRSSGLANWWLPKDVGGHGVSLEDSVEIAATLAYRDAGLAFTSLVSTIGTSLISLYGDARFRSASLGELARNGGYCATLGSELAAGSELERMGTTAVKRGDDLVLNGDKMFSTNAAEADFLVVFAKAEGDVPYVAAALPRSTPGVVIGRRWNTLGLNTSPVYQVSFVDCVVPSVLAGHGLRLLEVGLNASRVLIAATALGMARRIRDLCMSYAKTKQLKGSVLARNPVFAAKLAQMEVGILAMRGVCLEAAREYDAVMAGDDPAGEFVRRGALKSALLAKVFCGQTGWGIASVGSECFGGMGYTDASAIGGLMRDMRYVAIVEGGEDVMLELIYKRFVVPEGRRG